MSTFQTPNGRSLQLMIRGDTNDAAMANAILSTDEYRLKGLDLSGWALDIGSHIGTVGIALAVDNPELSVICVEPVPDNADLIRQSIAANDLGGRVFVEEAAAGAIGQATASCIYNFTDSDWHDKPGIHDSRYIGNIWRDNDNPVGTRIDAPVVTIPGLAEKYIWKLGGIDVSAFGGEAFRFCKIDCEGCVWSFFSSGAGLIQEIIGEWHDRPFIEMVDLIGDTHEVEVLDDKVGIGLFRAVRR